MTLERTARNVPTINRVTAMFFLAVSGDVTTLKTTAPPGTHEYMHLGVDWPLIAYFQSVGNLVDVAELGDLDPYGDKVWSPDEAALMADQLQRVYDDVESLWPWGADGECEPSEEVGGRGGVSDFLFWLRESSWKQIDDGCT